MSVELIDLRTVSPINYEVIYKSVKKTGNVLVLDIGNEDFGAASEIISNISINLFKYLKNAPNKIALPHVPTPTSFWLTKNFYPNFKDIILKISKILNKKINLKKIPLNKNSHDVPGDWFKGPF